MIASACNSGNDSGGESGASAGPPQPGGEIVIGLDAEGDGFNPATSQWGPATVQMALALMDPLTSIDEDGMWHPYLAESITPNDDFTEWTIRLRPGITFSSGNPVDAEAVKFNLDNVINSILVGPVLTGLNEPEVVDDLTLKLTTDEPWSSLPLYLAGQPGYIGDPEWLGAPDSDPQAPVGSGPFVLEERTLDAQTVVVRNDGYWRDPYPYLDRVTFRIVPDTIQRVQALETGELDLTISQNDEDVVAIEENPNLESLTQFSTDESFVMLNVSQPPFDNPVAREALALGMDRDSWNSVTNPTGITRLADSPWPEESPWHPEGVEFPDYDPDRARELVGRYEEETGEPLSFRFGTTDAPEAERTQDILAEQWRDIGVEVDPYNSEQATLISDVLGGDYQALVWRQFNSPDPDGESHWWFSKNAEGAVSTNFARNKDPRIDEALRAGRATDDVEVRRDEYRKVAEYLNEDLPYLWLQHTTWVVGFQKDLESVGVWEFPDGTPGAPVFNSQVQVYPIWLAP
ncbi:MAG: ABC transporter substrate-binding protein [Acidimicrobiia bacterium]